MLSSTTNKSNKSYKYSYASKKSYAYYRKTRPCARLYGPCVRSRFIQRVLHDLKSSCLVQWGSKSIEKNSIISVLSSLITVDLIISRSTYPYTHTSSHHVWFSIRLLSITRFDNMKLISSANIRLQKWTFQMKRKEIFCVKKPKKHANSPKNDI